MCGVVHILLTRRKKGSESEKRENKKRTHACRACNGPYNKYYVEQYIRNPCTGDSASVSKVPPKQNLFYIISSHTVTLE
jgi:hypothetical protein